MPTVTTRGDRELALRFENFPQRLHERLEQRIRALTEDLEERVKSATPYLTGRLRSEITARVFADDPERVAGYVSAYAQGEYAKAATLEYGTDKPRRARESKGSLLSRLSGKRRLTARISKPVHIAARRYLRDPLEQMQPQIEAALQETLAQAAAEDEAP